MTKRKTLPIALTIAGSDSGGGAGIQADLKTFAALGVHGTSAITCLTAQNPRRVLGVEPCSLKILRLQLEAVFAELPPLAIKTGMLFSEQNIRTIVAFFQKRPSGLRPPQLVVDPVMVSTSGARLLQPAAEKILQEKLLPLALLLQPVPLRPPLLLPPPPPRSNFRAGRSRHLFFEVICHSRSSPPSAIRAENILPRATTRGGWLSIPSLRKRRPNGRRKNVLLPLTRRSRLEVNPFTCSSP